MISEPFTISNTSEFNYELNYGITSHDTSINRVNTLHQDNSISYKLDLIDSKSGKKLGDIGTVEFNENNLPSFEEQKYKLNLKGIEGSKIVFIRIIAYNNFNGQCSLIETYSDEASNSIAKENIKEINFEDLLEVKDFELDQNYPNPFNPTTTISYQLPQDGIVTLKVYNMLGKEVASLVNNEFKTTGRYNVNFNANDLASGVYIYQLKISDAKSGAGFSAIKKLLLLK